MTKIAVVLPYFGKLPPTWFLTKESMEKNTLIDWLVFTDQEVQSQPNIKVHRMTLEEFRESISNRLGFSVSLEKPYKICDFRPAFGYIFNDILAGYDYWGYCDADVIFGNLDPHIQAGVATGFEKIFQRGHLSLLKNIDKVNNLFLRDSIHPGYKVVFTDSKNFLFDEGGGFYEMLAVSGMRTFEDNRLFDIIPARFSVQASTSRARRRLYIYKDGSLYEYDRNTKSETLEGRYIHLQKRPYEVNSGVQNLEAFTQGFVGVFTPTGIEKIRYDQIGSFTYRTPRYMLSYFRWLSYQLRRRKNKARIANLENTTRKNCHFFNFELL